MPRGYSRANQNKSIRQQALREQLAAKGLVQKVIEDSEKIGDLSEEYDSLAITRLKTANELRLKLIAKYLPDLKAAEITGADGEPLNLGVAVAFVQADADEN